MARPKGRALLDSVGNGVAPVRGETWSLGEPQFAADDVRTADDRHHLEERDAAAHALAAESAVTRQNQSFGRNVLECAPDQIGDLLGPLDLQVAVIDDADGDLLVGDLATDQLEIHAVAR